MILSIKSLLFLLLLLPLFVNGQTITTYAGNGFFATSYTGDGGLADTAQLGHPTGLNFDNSGNLLICHITDLVRKVDKLTTIITTIAGSDTASSVGGGGDGGPATCAAIVSPDAVCVDKVGNYYIADAWYSEIRKVDILTGIIDTFAGNRILGSTGDGGPAKHASLNGPNAVCFDTGQRYLYICEAVNSKIRRVDMINDTIGTFAGTGTIGYSGDGGLAINAKFNRLLSMCMDKNNNLYIGDGHNARIRRVDAVTGIVTTICGNGTYGYSGDGGPATNAMIFKPSGICFDKCGNLYFSDSTRVRRIDMMTGIINTIAGNGFAGFSGDSGPALNAEFNIAGGVAIDSMGNLYIGDYFNYRVRKMTFPNPFIRISSISGDTICAGNATVIQATIAAGGVIPEFQWIVNGIVVSGTTSSTYIYTPSSGDSISCILTSSSSCVGDPTATSNTIHFVTDPSYVPTITITSTPSAIVGSIVTVNAVVTGAGSSYNINWYDNGVLFNTTSTPSTTYNKGVDTDHITATVIPIPVAIPPSCIDSTTSAAYTVNAVPESVKFTSAWALHIYPNPATTSLTITSPDKITQITITNLIGQTVYTQPCNTEQVLVDVSSFPVGMYFVKVNDGVVRKFVKE